MGGVESYATDEPDGVADLVRRCLSTQDRLLLAHKEKMRRQVGGPPVV